MWVCPTPNSGLFLPPLLVMREMQGRELGQRHGIFLVCANHFEHREEGEIQSLQTKATLAYPETSQQRERLGTLDWCRYRSILEYPVVTSDSL